MDIDNRLNFRLTKAVRSVDPSTVRALLVVLGFNCLVVAVLLIKAIPHHTRVVIDNLSQCGGPFLAFVWCTASALRKIWLSKKDGTQSYPGVCPALCFAIGALSFVIGQAIWTYYELVLKVATPFPSWADAGYLTAYPFLFIGVLTLPAGPVSSNRRIVVLFESLMFIAGIVTFSWYFILGPTVLQTGESTIARVLGTCYPVCDLGLICCLLLLFARAGGGQLKSVAVILAAGLGCVIAVDSVFDYQTLQNTYETGHIIDVGWTLGYMLIAVAGYSALLLKSTKSEAQTKKIKIDRKSLRMGSLRKLDEIRPVLVQYSVVVMVAGLLWETSRAGGDHRLNLGVHIGAATVVALLLLRQFFMLLENQELNSKLATFNENLEAVVAQRTHDLRVSTEQLLALQRLTSAINDTLDQTSVINSAAINIQAAFNGASTIVWLSNNTGTQIDPTPRICLGLDPASAVIKCAVESQPEISATVHHLSYPSEDGGPDLQFELLQAPLRSRGALTGKVGIIRAPSEFNPNELDLLDSIALSVASALANAKQYWNARDAADRDPITGVYNHRSIHEYLDTTMEMFGDLEEPVAVILADVDNFGMFNDTYGHPSGDDILCRLAAVIGSTLTAPIRVGRYSGDEFMIVLPGYTSEQAVEIAKQLIDPISRLEVRYNDDERTIPINLSFGVAAFPLDSTDRHDLLVTADNNLTDAKNSDAHIVALSEIKRAHRELKVSSSFRMLDGMVTAVDNKDRYTRKHSEDVTEFALLIATELGLSDEFKKFLHTGGLLHDVGKIGVPDEILRKPGRLEDAEFNIMKQHPTLGALIVGGVAGMEDIIDAVKYHHERWDGKGYPEGLEGTQTPLIARILAVADAMSAMTTNRPYRKGMSTDQALDQIRKNTGTQFDPEMAEAFLRVAEKGSIVTAIEREAAANYAKAA